jgi:hypothetical protein
VKSLKGRIFQTILVVRRPIPTAESAKGRLNGENRPKRPETARGAVPAIKKLLFIINGFAFRQPFCQEIK